MTPLLGEFAVGEAAGSLRQAAMDQIDASYRSDFGHVPRDGFDEVATFIVATSRGNGELAGAVRLLPPSLRPFDLDGYVDLSEHLPASRSIALLGRLSVAPEFRRVRTGQVVQIGLLQEVCRIAISLNVTDLVIYTFPRLVRLYRAVLFEPLGVGFFHPVAKCDMSVMRLDLACLQQSGAQASRTGRMLLGLDPHDTQAAG